MALFVCFPVTDRGRVLAGTDRSTHNSILNWLVTGYELHKDNTVKHLSGVALSDGSLTHVDRELIKRTS